MKATGIVRRIDDLGRVVIPKEIRRTMRIREGDPLEIYTTRDGEVIFKKYSLIGGLEDFAAQFCDTLSRNTDFTAAVTDRDGIVAVAGAGKRELLGKNLSPQLEQIMEQRSIYQYRSGQERLPVSESTGQYAAAVAAPILCGGDVLGLVLFVSAEDRLPGEGEYKLAQAVAGFLGKHMETGLQREPGERCSPGSLRPFIPAARRLHGSAYRPPSPPPSAAPWPAASTGSRRSPGGW